MTYKYSHLSREKGVFEEDSAVRKPLNNVDLVNERARQQRYNAVLHRIKRSFHRETERLHFTNVLEIDCGTGSDILHLAKRYPKIQFTGIDASEENIRQAKKRATEKIAPNVRFICLSADRLSEVNDGGKFDLVCMYLNEIQSLTELQNYAREIRSICTEDAHLVFTCRNRRYLSEIPLLLLKGRFSKIMNRVRRSDALQSGEFTYGEIRSAFETNFEIVVKRGYCIFFPEMNRAYLLPKSDSIRSMLWNLDKMMNATPFWKTGAVSSYVMRVKG